MWIIPALWINLNANFLDHLNIFPQAPRHFSIFHIYPCIYFFTCHKFKIRSRSKKGKERKFSSIEASLTHGTAMNRAEILVIFRSVYFVPVLELITPGEVSTNLFATEYTPNQLDRAYGINSCSIADEFLTYRVKFLIHYLQFLMYFFQYGLQSTLY